MVLATRNIILTTKVLKKVVNGCDAASKEFFDFLQAYDRAVAVAADTQATRDLFLLAFRAFLGHEVYLNVLRSGKLPLTGHSTVRKDRAEALERHTKLCERIRKSVKRLHQESPFEDHQPEPAYPDLQLGIDIDEPDLGRAIVILEDKY